MARVINFFSWYHVRFVQYLQRKGPPKKVNPALRGARWTALIVGLVVGERKHHTLQEQENKTLVDRVLHQNFWADHVIKDKRRKDYIEGLEIADMMEVIPLEKYRIPHPTITDMLVWKRGTEKEDVPSVGPEVFFNTATPRVGEPEYIQSPLKATQLQGEVEDSTVEAKDSTV